MLRWLCIQQTRVTESRYESVFSLLKTTAEDSNAEKIVSFLKYIISLGASTYVTLDKGCILILTPKSSNLSRGGAQLKDKLL